MLWDGGAALHVGQQLRLGWLRTQHQTQHGGRGVVVALVASPTDRPTASLCAGAVGLSTGEGLRAVNQGLVESIMCFISLL